VKSISLTVTFVSLSLLLSACSDKKTSEYQNLSEKPPLSIVPHSSEVSESVIQTRLRLHLDNLQQKLEQDIPATLYDSPGEVKQKCVRIFGKKHCEEFQVGGWAKRTGPVQLHALNNGYLRVQIPLQYKLNATADGRLIRGLLREVDFKTASFTAVADLRPVMDTNWRLNLLHQTQIVWQKPPQVSVLGIRFDIQNQIEKPLKKALNKALAKQQKKLASDDRIYQQMEKFWTRLQTPRSLSDKFPLWIRANPSELALSELRIVGDAIELDLSLRAKLRTASDEASLSAAATPLPPLSHTAISASQIRINLPLALDYQVMAERLQQGLKNKPINISERNTSIQVNEVEIYPNNDRLVLATKVTLNGFNNWFNSDGEIYISGRPVVDNQTKTVRLAEAAFSRQLDSPFWSVATQLMKNQLLESLQKSLVHDFSHDYQQLYDSLNQQLQGKQSGDMRLQGVFQGLVIKDIYPDLDELRLVLEASGVVDVEVVLD